MSGYRKHSFSCPRLLALFQKRIEGDDALLELARVRFRQAGLGVECYAETPDELEWMLGLRPSSEGPATAHLSRSLNLLEEEHRSRLMTIASKFQKRVYGLVVHDQREIASQFDDYVAAVRNVASGLERLEDNPYLFLEYAAGLEPELYIELIMALRDLPHVNACIDTGHLGLWRVRRNYAIRHPGTDVCSIKPHDPELPAVIEDVQEAVCAALSEVVHVVREIGSLRKPLHFHLHDGHPLYTLSPFGVSDHLSFLAEVAIPFDYRGRQMLHPMFGPSGLEKIVKEALQLLGPGSVSFSLEIHPTEGRIPLGDAGHLFRHWADKENAERMNFWLSVLAQNHLLVADICEKVCEDG